MRSMSEHDTLKEAFVHHTTNADAEWVDDLESQKRAMRATEAFHMDVRGWSAIGYSFVVFQPYGGLENARVFQGRPTKFVPAAQEGHNTGTVPICVFGNFQADDQVKAETVTAICRVIRWVEQHHDGSLQKVGGHRDVGQTTCPGNSLYSKLDEIARRTDLRRF
jgi:hypothetical protein